MVLALRSSSLIESWALFEGNLLTFVLFLHFQGEARVALIKYFVIQSRGSMLFLRALLFSAGLGGGEALARLAVVRMVLKLGVAPLHW